MLSVLHAQNYITKLCMKSVQTKYISLLVLQKFWLNGGSYQ